MSLSILVDNGEALISFSCTLLSNGSDLTQRLKIGDEVSVKENTDSEPKVLGEYSQQFLQHRHLPHRLLLFL
ncbi:hypothetical protein BpHYR1_035266 [Brachionus plicatilis]|uniref:Uncharacterized protein n=1 Tax=Brachionus plicatilis TaxID=10195 RepID=A0A3M7PCJ1_BRAPC|nr:hypothetical protein BpHYR1_035266 [Brachionus plicatilis]